MPMGNYFLKLQLTNIQVKRIVKNANAKCIADF